MMANPKPEQLEHIDDHVHNIPNRLALAQEMSDEEFLDVEKRLKLKLDIRLMALLVLIYMLNYLDRNNIAAAKIAGIQESLHLTSSQFSTAVALLFAGYIIMQVPSNMFLAQFRPSIYIPMCMVLWGIVSGCTGATQSSGGLYATRFILGFFEAAYYPGSLFLISSWYKRNEMGTRCAFLYSGSLIGSAFSGLIAAGIADGLNGVAGLAAWRWIFIIEGSATVMVAICAFLILPDFPSNTRWLSNKERVVAEWRLVKDAGQVDEDGGSWSSGFSAAFHDWRTYVFAFMLFCVLVTTSTQNFFPEIVATLGFDRYETLLLTAPPYLLGAFICVANNISADKNNNASFHIMWPMIMAALGFVLVAAVGNSGARYFAMFLIIAGGHSTNAVVVAWVQKTMLRPRMKRAATVAFVNACGNSAQIWTSYLYPNQDAPRYILAMSINSAFALGAIALSIFMRIILRRTNKKLAAGFELSPEIMDSVRGKTEVLTEEEQLERQREFRFVT